MNAKKMYLSVFLGVLLLSSCKTARDMVSEMIFVVNGTW